MNNLTSTILTKQSSYDVDEFVKQGNKVVFDSSSEQRMAKYSIPSISVKIRYTGLTNAEFESLRTAYESNYANTFIVQFDSDIDMRGDLMTVNSETWIFQDFKFEKRAGYRIDGEITLFTSVLFNFTEYQNLFTESSSNTLSTTADTSFKTILQTSSPHSVGYSYEDTSMRSAIGNSIQFNRDKGGLRRKYYLMWILEESEFISILKYYRKKSGIMGEFGITDIGINDIILIKSRFENNSIQYVKRQDGLYEVELTTIEVK